MENIRSESNYIVLQLAVQCVANLVKEKNKSKRRRIWMKDWISRREDFGASSCLLTEMRQEDIDGYRNHLRMLPEKFDELLGKIANKIKKKDCTHMRNAISPKTKLAITLIFLATGDSFASLEALYRVGKSIISQFVPFVCGEIVMCLMFCIVIYLSHESPVNASYMECGTAKVNQYLELLERALLYMVKHVKSLDIDAMFGVAVTRGQILQMNRNNINVVKCLLLTNHLMEKFPKDKFSSYRDNALLEIIYSTKLWHNLGKISHDLVCINVTNDRRQKLKNLNEEQSDKCLIELSKYEKMNFSESVKCEFSKDCEIFLKEENSYGYGLLHKILFNVIADAVGCPSSNWNQKMCCQVWNELQVLLKHGVPLETTDLFSEEVLICSLSGFNQFLQREWIEKIVKRQSSVGCWWDYVTLNNIMKRSTKLFGDTTLCSTHTTGVSISLLALVAKHSDLCYNYSPTDLL